MQRRCIKKERIGARIRKVYDNPKTPYQRVLEDESVSEKDKIKLKEIYKSLDPIKLRREIIKIQAVLLKDEKIRKRFVAKLRAKR